MNPIIQPKQVHTWIENNKVTMIDVRAALRDPDAGLKAYEKAHIPGAYYLHLENDLSSEKGEHGGNHPLPDTDVLAAKLREMGVEIEKPIVIYDAANEMFAARAWWLLHYLGHPEVYVLDGGWAAWEEAGYATTSEIPAEKQGAFTAQVLPNETRTMEQVRARGERVVLLDSRAPARYKGEIEPLYTKAGHIPGAKNYFWKDVLDEQGAWKSKEALQSQFAALKEADEIIVSCGSGVSACPNIIALKMAGFKHVKLYPGSYSDWISYADNQVETGEES